MEKITAELPEPVGNWVLKHKLSESEKMVPPQMTANGMYYHYQQVVAMMREYSNDKNAGLKDENGTLTDVNNELRLQLDARDKEIERLKGEIEEYEKRNTALHLKCIKDKTEAYKQIYKVTFLFEEQFKAFRVAIHFKSQDFNKAHHMAEADWQSYCAENHIQP